MENLSHSKKDKPLMVFFGKSKHLIEEFKDLYQNYNFYEISWRNLNKTDMKVKADILVICGYDYSSSLYEFDKYFDVNVLNPLKIIDLICKKNTKIIYMNTYSDRIKKFTFSRYFYAKYFLKKKLINKYKNIKIIYLKTLVGHRGELLIHGNFLTKFIFSTLLKIKVLNITNINELNSLLKHSDKSITCTCNRIQPLGLKIPRTLLLDRFLRLIFG